MDTKEAIADLLEQHLESTLSYACKNSKRTWVLEDKIDLAQRGVNMAFNLKVPVKRLGREALDAHDRSVRVWLRKYV